MAGPEPVHTEEPEVAAADPARAAVLETGSAATLSGAVGNRALSRLASHPRPELPPGRGSGAALALAARRLARAPQAKVGPAADIPEDRGDIERGVYAVTDKVTYGVRASSLDRPEGLWVDHLFDRREDAEAYAKELAASGEQAIRRNSALPYAWPGKDGKPGAAGNQVSHVFVIEVPAGTPHITGATKAQPESSTIAGLPASYAGGGPQTVLDASVKGKLKTLSSIPVAGSLAATAPPAYLPPPPKLAAPPAGTTKLADGSFVVVPPPALAVDDGLPVAQAFGPQLVRRFRNAEALRDFSAAEVRRLETQEEVLKSYGRELPFWQVERKAALEKQVAEQQRIMAAARADHDTIMRPGASPKEINEALARQGVAVGVREKEYGTGAAHLSGTGLSGLSLGESGVTHRTGTAETKVIVDSSGTPFALTRENDRSVNVGLGTAKVDDTKRTTIVRGDQTETTTNTRSRSGSLLTGSATWDETDTREEKDAATGITASTTKKDSTTLGLGGYSRTKEDSTTVDGQTYGKSTTSGFGVGDGKAGYSRSTTKKDGNYDAEGKLVKGSESTTGGNFGLVADPEKGTVGLAGGVNRNTKRAYGNGVSTTTTQSADGRVTVAVTPYEDPDAKPEDEPRFRLTLAVFLGAKLGGGAGFEHESEKQGAKGNVGGSLGVSGSYVASFGRLLDAEGAKRYADAVKSGGKTAQPDWPEFNLVRTGYDKGWGTALELWRSMGQPTAADVAKGEVGDVHQVAEEVGGEGAFSAGGSGGGASLGIELGATVKGNKSITTEKLKDDKLKLTVSIGNERQGTAGGKVGMGAVEGGVSFTSGSSRGRSVVFVLDTKAASFSSRYAKIVAAPDQEHLDALAVEFADALSENTKSEGTSDGETVSLGIGPVKAQIGGTGKVDQAVTRDKDGNVTKWAVTGTNTGGGSVALGPVKVGDSVTETFTTEVDKDGNATGSLKTTTRSTSTKKTLIAVGEALEQGKLSAILSPGSLVKEDEATTGELVLEDQLEQIAAEAGDRKAWDKHVVGGRSEDWQATRRKVTASAKRGPDGKLTPESKAEISKAVAEYTGDKSGGRAEGIEAIIRPPGQETSAARLSWPEGTGQYEGDFTALVARDGFAGARAKLGQAAKEPGNAAGLGKAAQEEIAGVQARLETMLNVLNTHRGLHDVADPLAFAEMTGRISRRLDDAEKLLVVARRLQAPAKPVAAAAAAPTAATPAPDPAEEARRAEAQAKADERNAAVPGYNRGLAQLDSFRENVQPAIGQAEASLNRIFKDWDTALKKLKDADLALKQWEALWAQEYELAVRYGFDKEILGSKHPAGLRGYWARVDASTRMAGM